MKLYLTFAGIGLAAFLVLRRVNRELDWRTFMRKLWQGAPEKTGEANG